MAELFQTTKQNVILHIKNILAKKELGEETVVKEFLTTASDGKNYQTHFYNLDDSPRSRPGWRRILRKR
jgi:hypothetical protein